MGMSALIMGKASQSLLSVPTGGLKMDLTRFPKQKGKVVVIMGATGAGKSRLSIDLATRFFPSEIINSDKMQVYEGLDVVTNKITKAEQRGIPHHLLGTEDPNGDFTASDFCDKASLAINSTMSKGHLPIIVGGSNSYIEALIDDDYYNFRSRYDLCLLWVDVALPTLYSFVSKRVDQMNENGMVDELKPYFNPNGDYSRGIRRAIGVPEFHGYFENYGLVDEKNRKRLLEEAVREIKKNNCELAHKQMKKIHRLVEKWEIHRLDATEVFQKQGRESDKEWERMVAKPSALILDKFLCRVRNNTKAPASHRVGFDSCHFHGDALPNYLEAEFLIFSK